MAKQLTKDNPARKERDRTIINLRLQGKTYREIEKEVGISKCVISATLNDEKAKELIDSTYRDYAKELPIIKEEFIALCHDDDKSVRQKALSEYHKIMGILPSHTSNIFIQNLNISQNNVISPDVLGIIQGIGSPQPIDAEFSSFDEE